MWDRRQKNQRFFSYNLFSKDRKGVSGVVAMVLMIALVVVSVGVVWVVVNNLVGEEIKGAESCFGIFDKVKINSGYTCYNSSDENIQFSISLGDIEIDEILVAISSQGTTSSFKLADDLIIDNLCNFPDCSTVIKFPEKNGGRTYIFDLAGAGFSGAPDNIAIAPIVGTKQCGVTDSFSQFENCLLFS